MTDLLSCRLVRISPIRTMLAPIPRAPRLNMSVASVAPPGWHWKFFVELALALLPYRRLAPIMATADPVTDLQKLIYLKKTELVPMVEKVQKTVWYRFTFHKGSIHTNLGLTILNHRKALIKIIELKLNCIAPFAPYESNYLIAEMSW